MGVSCKGSSGFQYGRMIVRVIGVCVVVGSAGCSAMHEQTAADKKWIEIAQPSTVEGGVYGGEKPDGAFQEEALVDYWRRDPVVPQASISGMRDCETEGCAPDPIEVVDDTGAVVEYYDPSFRYSD
jgi:hypothetical protein